MHFTLRSEKQLVLLPGMGADERLFEHQRRAFPNLMVPPWIESLDSETISAYASRLADTIKVSRPFYLGGVSFGGMVALEMAERLGPEAVFLIGSARSSASIPFFWKTMERLTRFAPIEVVEALSEWNPFFARKFGLLTAEQKDLFMTMLKDADMKFIRWGCRALMDWQGPKSSEIPVHHIHGAEDKLIPPRLAEADRLVPGAGHLLNLSHPPEVNAILLELIERRSIPHGL